jgi:hypothetical protein
MEQFNLKYRWNCKYKKWLDNLLPILFDNRKNIYGVSTPYFNDTRVELELEQIKLIKINENYYALLLKIVNSILMLASVRFRVGTLHRSKNNIDRQKN